MSFKSHTRYLGGGVPSNGKVVTFEGLQPCWEKAMWLALSKDVGLQMIKYKYRPNDLLYFTLDNVYNMLWILETHCINTH